MESRLLTSAYPSPERGKKVHIWYCAYDQTLQASGQGGRAGCSIKSSLLIDSLTAHHLAADWSGRLADWQTCRLADLQDSTLPDSLTVGRFEQRAFVGAIYPIYLRRYRWLHSNLAELSLVPMWGVGWMGWMGSTDLADLAVLDGQLNFGERVQKSSSTHSATTRLIAAPPPL